MKKIKELTKEFLQEEYFEKGKSGRQIAKEIGCQHCTVYRALIRHGLRSKTELGLNPSSKKGIINDSNGYKRIRIPDHPKVNQAGYVTEHVLVVEQKYGRLPKNNEHIHHINGDKQNNDPDNLYLCTRSEHAKIHGSLEALLPDLMLLGIVCFKDGVYELL